MLNVVDELVHYCKDDDPLGALMLTGEWGSGKTYMIENDLVKALGPKYVIIRISLFGISTVASLQETIRRRWLFTCYPITDKLQKERDIANKNNGLLKVINSFIKQFNPFIGNTAEIVSSVNILDLIDIEPTFEDFHTQERKKAILVFDDLERCSIGMNELLGVINECCENQRFNTIIVTNLKFLLLKLKGDAVMLNMLKEKTIFETIQYKPDYETIISHIIAKRKWNSEEYRQFLNSEEKLIGEIFVSEDGQPCEGVVYEKPHNLLTLTSAMQSFYRFYYHLKKSGIEEIRDFLASYLPYMLCHNNAIFADGQLQIDFSEKDIKKVYPHYCEERMFPSVRYWIKTGEFNEEAFCQEIDEYKKRKSR